jgi:crotonobetainyl-CoA:carnitine CoA-transferase CaiB-like acyl-CoA transferase
MIRLETMVAAILVMSAVGATANAKMATQSFPVLAGAGARRLSRARWDRLVHRAIRKFAHGGPSIEHPPHEMGQATDRVLGQLGYDDGEISRLRKARVI